MTNPSHACADADADEDKRRLRAEVDHDNQINQRDLAHGFKALECETSWSQYWSQTPQYCVSQRDIRRTCDVGEISPNASRVILGDIERNGIGRHTLLMELARFRQRQP